MIKYYLEYNLKMNITEKIIINETEKLINIRGTYGLPLFNSKDIENALELKNIRNLFKKVENKDMKYLEIETNSGIQKTLFLTNDGLTEILRHTKKPNRNKLISYFVNLFSKFENIHIYNEFKKKGVTNYFTKEYELEQKLKEMNKINNEFYEKMKDKEVIFVTAIAENIETTLKCILIKSSNDIKKTNEELVKEYEESKILYAFETMFSKELVDYINNHESLSNYHEYVGEGSSSEFVFEFKDKNIFELLFLINKYIIKKN